MIEIVLDPEFLFLYFIFFFFISFFFLYFIFFSFFFLRFSGMIVHFSNQSFAPSQCSGAVRFLGAFETKIRLTNGAINDGRMRLIFVAGDEQQFLLFKRFFLQI